MIVREGLTIKAVFSRHLKEVNGQVIETSVQTILQVIETSAQTIFQYKQTLSPNIGMFWTYSKEATIAGKE